MVRSFRCGLERGYLDGPNLLPRAGTTPRRRAPPNVFRAKGAKGLRALISATLVSLLHKHPIATSPLAKHCQIPARQQADRSGGALQGQVDDRFECVTAQVFGPGI